VCFMCFDCSSNRVASRNVVKTMKLSACLQWHAEGAVNGATAPGIQGRGASKEFNYKTKML